MTKRKPNRSAPPPDIDAYLAAVDGDKRASLQSLRLSIRAAAPGAEECISYGLPSFRLNGKLLVSFGAAKNHCSFYPGALPIERHQSDLAGYETSKGTIRFTPERLLSNGLIRKLVQTRIAEKRE